MTPEQHRKHRELLKNPTFNKLKSLLRLADSRGLLEDIVWELCNKLVVAATEELAAKDANVREFARVIVSRHSGVERDARGNLQYHCFHCGYRYISVKGISHTASCPVTKARAALNSEEASVVLTIDQLDTKKLLEEEIEGLIRSLS